MDLLFKITNDDAQTGQEVVGDSNFKAHFPALHHNMSWSTLLPFIRQATRDHVIPFIGQSQYDDIADKFQTDAALNTSQSSFLEYLQDTVAYYTVYHAIPSLNLVISDMGVQESESSEGTSRPVTQWRYKNALWKVSQQADANLDATLAYMEYEIEEHSNAYFDLWKNDTAYNAAVSSLFRHTSDVSKYIEIHKSRRTYLALLPHLRRAEDTKIADTICQDMLNELASQVEGNSLTAENQTLLPYVQRAAAHWALHLAVPHLSLMIESNGIKVVSSTDGFDNRGNVLSAFAKEAVVRLQQRAEDDAKTAIASLLKFLYANSDDYPTWKDSACYFDPEEVDPVVCSEDEIGGVMV